MPTVIMAVMVVSIAVVIAHVHAKVLLGAGSEGKKAGDGLEARKPWKYVEVKYMGRPNAW